jgi:nicotinamidase-related amidase
MNKSALLLIDVQQGFDDPGWGKRNNPDAEKKMAQLLHTWRKHNWPIIHVQHLSINPDSPLNPANGQGYFFRPETAPTADEVVFTKNVNSAFIGTELGNYLHENEIASLVIVGLTTDHCVSTTARMAGNLGFTVQLVSDGTATFEREDVNGEMLSAEEIHRVHLASLHGEFCTVVTTEEVLQQVTASQAVD